MAITASAESLRTFWEGARGGIDEAPVDVPEAWAFGATTDHADELLRLVASGVKTATASSLWDFETTGEEVPLEGSFSIILDGRGVPKAVIRTTKLTVMAFSEVPAEHAYAEGEGDRTLATWRDIHERYWRAHLENDRGFEPDMPVLCEKFEVVFVAEGFVE